MKIGFMVLAATVGLSTALSAQSVKTRGTVKDTLGKKIGTITASEWSSAAERVVEFKIKLKGLTPGLHGMHVHAGEACEAPSFSSTGPHLNPEQRKHGHKNADGPHRGDLGNIRANDKGEVDTTMKIKGTILLGENSFVNYQLEFVIVIHAREDDEESDPSGKSGLPIACVVMPQAR